MEYFAARSLEGSRFCSALLISASYVFQDIVNFWEKWRAANNACFTIFFFTFLSEFSADTIFFCILVRIYICVVYIFFRVHGEMSFLSLCDDIKGKSRFQNILISTCTSLYTLWIVTMFTKHYIYQSTIFVVVECTTLPWTSRVYLFCWSAEQLPIKFIYSVREQNTYQSRAFLLLECRTTTNQVYLFC
jgi:hypothetical protein